MPEIYAQRYNYSGTPVGFPNFPVSLSGVGYSSDIAMDSYGNFIITWEGIINGSVTGIYAQRYSSEGSAVGSSFKVSDHTATVDQREPDIAIDNSGKFVITWYDDSCNVYAQRYDSSGAAIGKNYLVPNSLYASFAQQLPSVATNGAKIYYTWQDNRRGNWDIYAKSMYFLRGNVNGDGKVSLSDVVYLINYLFKFGPEPIPELGVGDANCDGKVSISDIVCLINYLFKFGPPPCP